MNNQKITVLQETAILRGLDEAQLQQFLDSNEIRTLRESEFLFEQGDEGKEMYVLLEGEAHLMVDPATLGSVEAGSTELRRVHTFKPGDSFGEMAIIDGSPRSGAVKAGTNGTRFLVMHDQMFTEVIEQTENPVQTILNNITRDIVAKTRRTTDFVMEQMLSGYFISILVEELSGDTYHVDPIVPLQRTMVIRDADSFLLSGSGRIIESVPEKEAINLYFFTEQPLLQHLISSDDPSGAIIFNALFSLIRDGQLSGRIDPTWFRFEMDERNHRRSGKLHIAKNSTIGHSNCSIEWQIKGTAFNPETRVCSSNLFLYLNADGAQSTGEVVEQVVRSISMPVQKHFKDTLPIALERRASHRIMVIHHRSHEVAYTLKTLRDLGYQLDTFIGIPYGEVDWATTMMLDGSSDQCYMSLKVVNHPTAPTHYEFDFLQSSFLDSETERTIRSIYEDPDVRYNYFRAMQAIAEFRLEGSIATCRAAGQKLIIYEDGAYIVGKIYSIYFDSNHRLHSLIKTAVDDGTIVGVVEVTVAGERKNTTLIEENDGKGLLPVLSNARSDIKAIFETVGVAEAVTYASATALGRMGLPTFQTRRIGVIGANGAIGTRVIERFALSHNSAANVFAVDITTTPFSMDVDSETLPHAAIRLKYHDLPRFRVEEDCFPAVLNLALNQSEQPSHSLERLSTIVTYFLTEQTSYAHLAVTDSHPIPNDVLTRLWAEVISSLGYSASEEGKSLDNDTGVTHVLSNGKETRRITFLRPSVILTFTGAQRIIRAGVDTVIGVTGLPIFSAKDLDSFLYRNNPTNAVDELVLISGSSKDYEFRKAIDLLDTLLTFCSNRSLPADEKLALLAPCYADRLSFLEGNDFQILAQLFSQPITGEALLRFKDSEPEITASMGLNNTEATNWPELLANHVGMQISRSIEIRKDIRPDIGTVYHIVVNGQVKRVVMLADGFVVNFYAKHEKGVKTEFIDPVITMQLLSLVRLSGEGPKIHPALYKMEDVLEAADMEVLWKAVDDRCRPLHLS